MPSTFFPTCLALAVSLGAGTVACVQRSNVQCSQDSNCDLSANGLCVADDSANHWCAYPDASCQAGGYRFATDDVGNGLGGQCVASGFTLQVMIGGSGSGTIDVTPSPLTCTNSVCSGAFPKGTQVQLKANATTGDFLGWSNACHGADSCMLTMDRPQAVGALFGVPGESLWVTQLGGPASDQGKAVAVDKDNNIIAVGLFTQTATIGATTLTSNGTTDAYVAKLDGNTGAVIWAKSFGGTMGDNASSVAVDDNGNVYVGGTFSSTVDFGGGPITSTGSGDGFVLKLSPAGDFVWARQLGGSGFDATTTIAVRGTSVAVAGSYVGSMTIDGKTLTSNGSSDVFVELMNTDGVGQWSTSFGHADLDAATQLVLDGPGNVIVGGTSRVSSTVIDMFLTKLSGANGTSLFSKTLTSASDDSLAGVAIDESGDIYFAGGFAGSLDLGNGQPLVSTAVTAGHDVFVAKYSQAGAYLWGKSFSGTGTQEARAVAVNGQGDLVIAGDFTGTLSFGGPPLSAAGESLANDAFIVRLAAADAGYLKSVRVGGTGSEEANSVCLSSDGHYFVTGSFDGFAEFGGQALTSKGLFDAFVLAFAPL